MTEIISKHYKKSRTKNLLRLIFKKILQMGTMVIIGEYMLLHVINVSLSEHGPMIDYRAMPTQLVNLAVSEKPILRVAKAYNSIKNNIDFNNIIHVQFPVAVKGARPDFRTLNLQDKEGAKVGYVVKF